MPTDEVQPGPRAAVTDPLQVAMLGPGGVGGLLAALLSRMGDTVTCLAAADTVTAIRQHGILVASDHFGAMSAQVEAAERLGHHVDVCFITVKANQLETALERVPPEVLDGSLLVPLLNGVEHLSVLRRRYPGADVAGAAIRVESTRIGPGEIRHHSPFVSMELAVPRNGDADVRRLAAHLEAAGLDVRVRDDESGVLWDKLCFLAPLALLTSHDRAPVGVVREQRREELNALVAEVASVARAEGASEDEQSVLRLVAAVPASMQTSMQRDAAAGRPTELEAIGGAVLRAAERAGISVPVTARLVEDLRTRWTMEPDQPS